MNHYFDRTIEHVRQLLVLGPAQRRSKAPAPSSRPDDRRSRSSRATSAGVIGAAVAPIAFAALLIPGRDALSESLSLLMVLPIVVVAVVGGARLATIAAISGALAFGVFHTEPYYRFAIDLTADVVEMAVLLIVGILTGVIASSAQRALAGASARRRELDAVTEFLDRVDDNRPDDMIDAARSSIQAILQARSSTWRAGYRGTAAPTLQRSGAFSATNAVISHQIDQRALPSQIEIPVGQPPREHGRIIVSGSGADVSIEERRTAATIAFTLGRLLGPTDH